MTQTKQSIPVKESGLFGTKRDNKPHFSNSDLYRAIYEGQFVVHYLPKINIATGTFIGVEALVRWRHPELGIVFPNHFIHRLERLSLMDQLGWIVASISLADLSRFSDLTTHQPTLALNISASTLRDPQFPDVLSSLLKAHRMSSSNLTLEITDPDVIEEMTNAVDVLDRLHLKSFQISINELGVGRSLMQQLCLIPATELKIDRRLVGNIHVNVGCMALIRKTIETGHELGMRIVAEGVETEPQLAFLRENHCDMAQGYLFSKPVPVDELAQWLRRYRCSSQTFPVSPALRLIA